MLQAESLLGAAAASTELRGIELKSSEGQSVVALIIAAFLWLVAFEHWLAAGGLVAIELAKRHVTYYILFLPKSKFIN